MRQELLATCGVGAPPARLERPGGPVLDLEDQSEDWDKRYGLRWRVCAGCPTHDDRLAVARRAGLKVERKDLEQIVERWEELVAQTYPRGLRGMPDPPGWEHLAA
jgi:hypothetical protein